MNSRCWANKFLISYFEQKKNEFYLVIWNDMLLLGFANEILYWCDMYQLRKRMVINDISTERGVAKT